MDWLINRRRMMFNRAIPPEYLTFEDVEFWRICCENFGDYNETVITDNGDNTVNIVTTFKSMLTPEVVKKSSIVSSQSNVDNSSGTYIAGTTKEAVGITQRQCDAITWLGRYGNNDLRGFFIGNTNILSLNDLQHFTCLAELRGNPAKDLSIHSSFYKCTNCASVILPDSLLYIGGGAFQNSKITTIDLKNVTYIDGYAFRYVPLTSFIPNEGLTNIGPYAFGNTNILYFDLPSTMTSIGRNNFASFSATIVCRAVTPPSFVSTGNTCKILYVPSASLEAYKTATGWSAFASKTYAIEGTWYETHRELEPTT